MSKKISEKCTFQPLLYINCNNLNIYSLQLCLRYVEEMKDEETIVTEIHTNSDSGWDITRRTQPEGAMMIGERLINDLIKIVKRHWLQVAQD